VAGLLSQVEPAQSQYIESKHGREEEPNTPEEDALLQKIRSQVFSTMFFEQNFDRF
jgi:hypothetical protein